MHNDRRKIADGFGKLRQVPENFLRGKAAVGHHRGAVQQAVALERSDGLMDGAVRFHEDLRAGPAERGGQVGAGRDDRKLHPSAAATAEKLVTPGIICVSKPSFRTRSRI